MVRKPNEVEANAETNNTDLIYREVLKSDWVLKKDKASKLTFKEKVHQTLNSYYIMDSY